MNSFQTARSSASPWCSSAVCCRAGSAAAGRPVAGDRLSLVCEPGRLQPYIDDPRRRDLGFFDQLAAPHAMVESRRHVARLRAERLGEAKRTVPLLVAGPGILRPLD